MTEPDEPKLGPMSGDRSLDPERYLRRRNRQLVVALDTIVELIHELEGVLLHEDYDYGADPLVVRELAKATDAMLKLVKSMHDECGMTVTAERIGYLSEAVAQVQAERVVKLAEEITGHRRPPRTR